MLRAIAVRSQGPAMKLRRLSLSTVLFGSSSVSFLPTCQSWVPSTNNIPEVNRGVVGRRTPMPSRLFSTLPAADEERDVVSTIPKPEGEVIAEGAVVSRYHGGLGCVKIYDEWNKEEEVSPKVLDPSFATPTQSTHLVCGDYLGRNVVFSDGSVGTVVAHRPPLIFTYCASVTHDQHDGKVKVLSSMSSVRLGATPGVVDAFGQYVGEKSPEKNLERAIFAPIPQVKDIALINNPMLTGVTIIDALAPIGRGQNMLLVGYDHDIMRGFAFDLIKTQCQNENTKCVYAAIDSKDAVINRLKELNLQDQVHVVVPDNTAEKDEMSRAAEAVTMAATACAIAEANALEKGMHTVVVIDSINQLKKFWDATTRCLVDVFGVDAVVLADTNGGASSEMRAFYSSLVQRAGQFKAKFGGGSVTLLLLITLPRTHLDDDTVFSEDDFVGATEKVKARIQLLLSRQIPLTADNLRKIDIPVPSATENERRFALQHVDDLISMSDGQIWLDEKLESSGQMPPMDPQRSVTRVGIGADTQSRADAPAFRRVVERLRLDLSQALNLEGVEISIAAAKQVRRQNALLLAMHQSAGMSSRRLSESCAVLLAASEGFLDDAIDQGMTAQTKEGQSLIRDLLLHLSKVAPELMEEIDSTLDISDKSKLREAIASFFHRD